MERRGFSIGERLLLAWGAFILLGITAEAVGPVAATVTWGVGFAVYLAARVFGFRDRLWAVVGAAIGAMICVLVIWGLLLGGGACMGWGCG